jgi:hypothetical protein
MTQRNRSISLKPGKSRAALTITHPNAAGIDIGSASHYVAVPPDRDDEPVREFPSFTVDLNAIADWLNGCGWTPSPWNPPVCTGSPCSSCWSRAASPCCWSTRATSRTSPGASPTCSTASGCSSS